MFRPTTRTRPADRPATRPASRPASRPPSPAAGTRRRRWAVLLAVLVCAPASLLAGAAPAAAIVLPTLPVVVDGAVLSFSVIGDRAFVGGTFTQVRQQNGTLLDQPYLFAYFLSSGAVDTGFRPQISGGEVLDLEPATGGAGLYAGGAFNSVNGATKRRIVRLNLDGTTNTAFDAAPNSRVNNIAVTGSRMFIGGQFSQVGGVARGLLAEVNPTTGALVTAFDFSLSGSVAAGGFVQTQAVEASPDGTRLLVAHNATTIKGQERIGIAVIDLGAGAAASTPNSFYTNLWKDALPSVGGVVRITDAEWGANTWFVVANGGGDRPATNDTVIRFDTGQPGPRDPRWVTRQFDTSFSVTVGADGTVYAGGHFRYTEAPGSTQPWPGETDINYGFGQEDGGARVLGGDEVVGRMQLAALDPTTGTARNWYTVADGRNGVTALKVTGNRLLVGHDGGRVGEQASGRHGAVPIFNAPRTPACP